MVAVPHQRASPRRLARDPSPSNGAEVGNIAAKGELLRARNRAWMPVRQIVQAQLSRGSRFVAMLGRDPHAPAVGQEGSMIEHILELYGASSAIFTVAFLALASRAAEWPSND
jgi:hypothetical protein